MLQKYSIKSIFSQRKFKKKHSGFLLIEALSALVLLGIVIAITTNFCWQTIAWQQESRLRTTAISTSSNLLESIKLHKKIPFNSQETKPLRITIEHHCVSHIPKVPYFFEKNMEQLHQITINIGWDNYCGQEGKYSITTCMMLDHI